MTASFPTKLIQHSPQSGWTLCEVYLGKWPCTVNIVVRQDSTYFANARSGFFQALHNKLVRLSDCLLADSFEHTREVASFLSYGLDFLCANRKYAPGELERMYQLMKRTAPLARAQTMAHRLFSIIQKELPSFKLFTAQALEERAAGHNGFYEACLKLGAIGKDYSFFTNVAHSIDLIAKSSHFAAQPISTSSIAFFKARRYAQYCIRDLVKLSAEQADLVLQSPHPQLISFFRLMPSIP